MLVALAAVDGGKGWLWLKADVGEGGSAWYSTSPLPKGSKSKMRMKAVTIM